MFHFASPSPKDMNAACALDVERNRLDWDYLPSGRMSLLDMMNFSLDAFSWAMRLLDQEMQLALMRIGFAGENAHQEVSETDKQRMSSNLEYITKKCRELSLGNAENRIQRCFLTLTSLLPPTYGSVLSDLRILKEAIEDDIKFEYFYHYRRDRGLLVLMWRGEWGATITSFPTAASEIEEGIDCFGLEHYPACVFHMMRVAELGMRALARERRVAFPHHPLEWAEWENLIDQINSKAKIATAGMSRGPQRDAARSFYAAAVAQLRAFKEIRNRIMHMRGSFDEIDAHRAINQVRDFMNGLSAKIGEKTRRAIPLSRWP